MREIAPNQYEFPPTSSIEALNIAPVTEPPAQVAAGGRLLAIRDQGQLLFGDLQDATGRIQVVADQATTPEYSELTQLSVGDWVGVQGKLANTKRGQKSIFLDDWARLAATELPFPDKRHGLRDADTIYRQRYVDLAVNPDSMQRFVHRSQIISLIRKRLESEGFMEVETPILQSIYGGAAAKPFITHHNTLDIDQYLRIAPELYLKRLVVGGMERVFEIGKVFRNEGISPRHNPEFTMMEVYAAYWDYEDQMHLTETLFEAASLAVQNTTEIEYADRTVNLTSPWQRATMDELVSHAVGETITIDVGVENLRQLCDKHEVKWIDEYGPGKLLLELYEKLVEKNLWGPIFVTDYPKEVSPLARDHRSRPGYTERFEGIVAGQEVCNGYTELNNAQEQYARFQDQEVQSQHDEEAMPMDYDYIRALQYGLPPTAGLGIGIDRMVMLLTGATSIKDVILFPTLKPDNFVIKEYPDK